MSEGVSPLSEMMRDGHFVAIRLRRGAIRLVLVLTHLGRSSVLAYDILEIRDFGLRHLGITTFWIRRFGITTFRIRRFGYFILDTTFWNTTFSPDTIKFLLV